MADSHGLSSSTGSMMKSEVNPVYRREVPDMESHTSVFPTSGGSPTSDSVEKRRKENSKLNHSLPTTWDHCVPPSLPSLSNPKRAREGENSYSMDISNPPLFHHEPPTSMPLDSQSFPMRYYNEPHLNHHQSQSQQTLPVLGLPGTDLGGCPQPYYFNY